MTRAVIATAVFALVAVSAAPHSPAAPGPLPPDRRRRVQEGDGMSAPSLPAKAGSHTNPGGVASAFRRKAILRVTAATVALAAGWAAWLLACGPFLIDLKTVQTIAPAQLESYGRGGLGIVRPRFARRFLVQAYRRMNGQPALPAVGAAVPFEFGGASANDDELILPELAQASADPLVKADRRSFRAFGCAVRIGRTFHSSFPYGRRSCGNS